MNKEQNGWTEWSKYVLKELERLNGCYESVDKKLDDKLTDAIDKFNELNIKMSNHIIEQKTKAATYGAVAGAVVSIVIMIIGGIGLALRFHTNGGG